MADPSASPLPPPEAGVPLSLLRQLNHDLRGPLNVLGATSDLLLEGGYGELSAPQQRAAQRLQRSAARTVTIMDHFMSCVRAQAGQWEVVLKQVEVSAFLDAQFAPVAAAAQNAGLTAALVIDAGVPAALMLDEMALTRAFTALCWNAVAFSPQGKITVDVTYADDALCMDMRDQGSGLDADVRARLYTPFCKGAAPIHPVPTSGCGLGLAMARALAEQAGGSLALVASAAGGSHFRLIMPYKA
jgi:signal transduction histidine kinase